MTLDERLTVVIVRAKLVGVDIKPTRKPDWAPHPDFPDYATYVEAWEMWADRDLTNFISLS